MSTSVIAEGYSYPTLLPLVKKSLSAGSSVMLHGAPGVGKSALAYFLATEAFRLPIEDIRLAQKDPSEVGGVYIPNHKTKTLDLYAPDWVRRVCEGPYFLFLDEINAAVSKLHQTASYQIILEHRVGPFRFHPQTVVMAAGNQEDDEALAVPMSSALKNRFCHFTMRVDADAWLKWAATQGLAPDVIAYIGFTREKGLYDRTGEDAYPTPRSWAEAAKLDRMVDDETERQGLIASAVGAASAKAFAHFTKVYKRVDVPAILQRGEIPALDPQKDIGFIYALTFAIGHLLRNRGLSSQQIPNLYKLFTTPGFGAEFQILLVKNLEGTKAFKAIMDSRTFDPIKIRLTKIVTAAD